MSCADGDHTASGETTEGHSVVHTTDNNLHATIEQTTTLMM